MKAQSTRNRPDRSIECLTFFEALLEAYPRVVTANLKFIIEGLLRIAIFLNVDEISCKVLDVISTIICQKTKVRMLVLFVISRQCINFWVYVENSQRQRHPTDAVSNLIRNY